MTDRADEIAAKVYDTLGFGHMISEGDLADLIRAYGDERVEKLALDLHWAKVRIERLEASNARLNENCESYEDDYHRQKVKHRNAALKEAEKAADMVDTVAGDAIRALKETNPALHAWACPRCGSAVPAGVEHCACEIESDAPLEEEE